MYIVQFQTKTLELKIISYLFSRFSKIHFVHPYEVRLSFVTKHALGEFRREDFVGEPGRAASPALWGAPLPGNQIYLCINERIMHS